MLMSLDQIHNDIMLRGKDIASDIIEYFERERRII